jgi:Ca2+-binding EF-hand superfamily protein
VANLINAALSNMKVKRQATQQDVQGLISAVDKNNDGKIGKP